MTVIGRVIREILSVLDDTGAATNRELRQVLPRHTSTGMSKYLNRCVARGFVSYRYIDKRDRLYSAAPGWRSMVDAYGRGPEPAMVELPRQFVGRRRQLPAFGAHNPWGAA